MAGSRGRPPIGPIIKVRLAPDLVDELDTLAATQETTRAEILRQVILDGLEIQR